MDKYRILVADDDHDITRELKKNLELGNYDVDTADNGRSAMDLWKKNIYDLLILDLRMPEVDGRELFNTVKHEQPYTQVIILSGQGVPADFIDAVNAHVFKYLKKPKTDLDLILKTVDEAIKMRDPVLLSLDRLSREKPDQPFLSVGKKTLSPKKLYDEVRKHSPLGSRFREEYMRSLTDFEPPEESLSHRLGIKGVIE